MDCKKKNKNIENMLHVVFVRIILFLQWILENNAVSGAREPEGGSERERERGETHLGVFFSFLSDIFGYEFMSSICNWGHKHTDAYGDRSCDLPAQVYCVSKLWDPMQFVSYLLPPSWAPARRLCPSPRHELCRCYTHTHTHKAGVTTGGLDRRKQVHTLKVEVKWGFTHILATSLTSSLHVMSFIWNAHAHSYMSRFQTVASVRQWLVLTCSFSISVFAACFALPMAQPQ